MNILLGVSGSVAAIKFWELSKALESVGQVRIVLTKTGDFFGKRNLPSDDLLTDSFLSTIYTDEDEWKWSELGDHILHIDLKDWADILVIAPLSANTLAKISNGLCDNLLTSIYRAWPLAKPIVVAPAMNTDMWEHPVTKKQLDEISQRHYAPVYNVEEWSSFPKLKPLLSVVEPVEKKLACGVHGVGAMASIETIVEAVKTYG